MTVGEKIQYYRKQCGFSQEELGQKLLVSRQTISLWEMDRTLPTIDNLIRLKEIFSVSVDELLGLEQAPAPTLTQTEATENDAAQPSVRDSKKKTGKWKVGSILLFIFSLLSPIFALITLGILSQNTKFVEDNFWVFFLYMLIPIGAIVYGILLKKRKYGAKKEFIAGGISFGVNCIFGLILMVVSLTSSSSPLLLIKAEETIGIDIPEYSAISTESEVYYEGWPWGQTILARSTVYFDDENVVDFENEMRTDQRWITTVSTRMFGIVPIDYRSDYEYVLLCNVDAEEFNTLPSESGNYHFITLLYDKDGNELVIVEYLVAYVA